MKIEFLNLKPAERAVYFQQAALKQSTLPVIVEKDFWVCWLLGVLFGDAELARQIVFKGGTSLSKVFGVIDRFSEDIDLSISPAFVGIDDDAIVAANTRTQRDRLMLRLEQSCLKAVRERIQPAIERVGWAGFIKPNINVNLTSCNIDAQMLRVRLHHRQSC